MSSSPPPTRSAAVWPERLAEACAVLFETAELGGPLEGLWLAWAVHPEGAGARHAWWLAWDADRRFFECERELAATEAAIPLAEVLRRVRREVPCRLIGGWSAPLEAWTDEAQVLWADAGMGPVSPPSGPRSPFAPESELVALAVRGEARAGGWLVLAGGSSAGGMQVLRLAATTSAAMAWRGAGVVARTRQRAALTRFAAAATEPGNLAESLHALLRAACDGLAGDGAAVWRVDGDGLARQPLASGSPAMRDVFANGLAPVAEDVRRTGLTRHAADGREGPAPDPAVIAELSAWVVTPITALGGTLGALAVWDGLERETASAFGAEDVECAQALARMAGLLLEVARRHDAEAAMERERAAMSRRVRHLESAEGLRELASRVAAEARNPLASIGAFARRAQKSLAADDPERESLDVVIRESERLEAMLHEQQQYSALQPAPLRMESLNDTLQASLQGVGETLVRRRLRLTKRLAHDLPPLLLDVPRIRRVFENVLSYALDAAPVGGRLRVESRRAGGFALVEIAHDGPRQAGDLIEHLFVSFSGTAMPGAAVGLSVAHQIVREHGGEVRVRSEGDWSAIFSCTLPIADNADRRDQRSRRNAAGDRRRRGPAGGDGLPLVDALSKRVLFLRARWTSGILASFATLAQLVEHVTENDGVPSSILGGRTIRVARRRLPSARSPRPDMPGWCSSAGRARHS